jgi:hypothetical protein
MTALPITGKVPPPVTIANASPSNGLGLRSALLMESFVSIRIKRNAGVAGAIVADVSRSPRLVWGDAHAVQEGHSQLTPAQVKVFIPRMLLRSERNTYSVDRV